MGHVRHVFPNKSPVEGNGEKDFSPGIETGDSPYVVFVGSKENGQVFAATGIGIDHTLFLGEMGEDACPVTKEGFDPFRGLPGMYRLTIVEIVDDIMLCLDIEGMEGIGARDNKEGDKKDKGPVFQQTLQKRSVLR